MNIVQRDTELVAGITISRHFSLVKNMLKV